MIDPPLAPPTDEAILGQTALRPEAPAVVNNGRAIPYAALAKAMTQFAQALHALGLRAGQVAAIECHDPYLHLLLLLGAERLGVVTASFMAHELAAEPPTGLFRRADLVITEQPSPIPGATRTHRIDRAWLDGVFNLSGDAAPPPDKKPGDGLRIQRTSGTTGVAKAMLLTRELHRRRMASWARIDPPDVGVRQLLALPFTIAATFSQASNALAGGGTLVFENRVGLAEALVLHAVDRITLLPYRLRQLVDAWPLDLRRPRALSILTIGGHIAPSLRRRALGVAATRLRELYSGNEAGNVAIVDYGSDPAAAEIRPAHGVVFPDVELEVLDDAGRPAPIGQAGPIRLRSPVTIGSYLDDPATTARMFKAGWFHPGDLGILRAPGQLEIVGRDDDLLNLGGIKLLPEGIEERIRAQVPLADIGVCALPDERGIDRLGIGLVYDAADDADIRARLRSALAEFPHGVVHLAKLPAIPRTGSGKVKRAELRRLMAEGLARVARGASETR